MKKYDIALIESDGCLTKDSYNALADMISGERMIPIEIEAAHAECSAMGFISEKAADQLDFDYDGLRKYLGRIMDDINLENREYTYKYEGLSIYMGYEKILQEEKKDVEGPGDEVYVVRVREHLGDDYNVRAASAEDAEAFIRDKYGKGGLTIDTEVIDTDIECTGLAKNIYENVYMDFDATEEDREL